MISKLDIGDLDVRNEILSLQKASYLVEAQLIDFYGIPGLIDDERKMLESQEIFYGFRADEQLIGIISYKVVGNVLDIHRVAIAPDYFQKGVASALVSHIETVETEVEKIVVSTGSKNTPACRLYKKLGYNKIKDVEVGEDLVVSKFEKRVK